MSAGRWYQAVNANNGAGVGVTGGTLSGRLVVNGNSKVDLRGVTQTSSGSGNLVAEDSTLVVNNASPSASSTLVGPVTVQEFSQLLLKTTSGITGNLTGCELCVKP